jgi:predicted AAA+ superfamily ATPase
MFEAVMRFVLANIGSQISAKSISDYLNSNNKKTYPQAVDDFLECLVDSYMVYRAERYDVKSKEILKSLGKYYATDIGLRNNLLGFREMDTGHVLENVIYLELLRRGYKVFVGEVDDKEVDFVAQKQDDTIYIQVAETLNGEGGREKTLERELAPFKAIKDYNQRLLLTMDYDPNTSYDGIKHINALDFLMSDKY